MTNGGAIDAYVLQRALVSRIEHLEECERKAQDAARVYADALEAVWTFVVPPGVIMSSPELAARTIIQELQRRGISQNGEARATHQND